jgi:anaerobic magnesium-protoporphyrin IX monomethyl ester cyclase
MARVGLIALYVVESNGIRYLSAALRAAGLPVDEIYLGYHLHHVERTLDPRDVERLVEHLRSRDVGVVGISQRVGALLPIAAELTRIIRTRLGIPVVWGGAHVTMAPEQCAPHADYLVMGEGEAALVDLARALLTGGDPAALPNVWSMEGGAQRCNPIRPLVEDLDSLPFPDFETREDKFWIRDGRVAVGDPLETDPVHRIMVTRGCPNNCGFCGVSAFRRVYDGLGRFYRIRSVENTIQELEHARRVRPRLRRVRFDDELFVPKRAWIEEFCREYPARVGLPFDILTSPKVLDAWTVDRLADAGLDMVYLGVQTTSAANRQRYDRTVPDAEVRACVQRLHARGIRPVVQVLIDDPDSTLDEQLALLEVLLALPRPYDLLIYSLCHWPGTARTRALIAEGTITDADVEGGTDKVLRQFNADFSVDRKPAERLMLALYMLSNKRLVLRPAVRWAAHNGYLRSHPDAVVAAAQAANIAKLAVRGLGALRRGELSLHTVRQWLGSFKGRRLPSV